MRDRLTSDKPEEMNNCRVVELCEKLKKYEEICIYPEKLKEISGLFLEKCQEVNRLKADFEKQKSGWILCSERLPEVPEGIEGIEDDDKYPEFNVIIKGFNKATTLRFSSDGWFDEFGCFYQVFAWQPLPMAFQEERISKNDTDQNNLITISP